MIGGFCGLGSWVRVSLVPQPFMPSSPRRCPLPAHKSWAVSVVVYCKKKKKKTARDRKKKKKLPGTGQPSDEKKKKKKLVHQRESVSLSPRTFAWWLWDFALCTTGNFVTETRSCSFLCPYRLIARRLLICSAVGVTGPRLAFGSFSKKHPGTGQP